MSSGQSLPAESVGNVSEDGAEQLARLRLSFPAVRRSPSGILYPVVLTGDLKVVQRPLLVQPTRIPFAADSGPDQAGRWPIVAQTELLPWGLCRVLRQGGFQHLHSRVTPAAMSRSKQIGAKTTTLRTNVGKCFF